MFQQLKSGGTHYAYRRFYGRIVFAAVVTAR